MMLDILLSFHSGDVLSGARASLVPVGCSPDALLDFAGLLVVSVFPLSVEPSLWN